MAKGKHAAALFEVIHSGRYPNKPLMNTPKWWFKRNKQNDPASASNGSDGDASASEADPTAARDANSIRANSIRADSIRADSTESPAEAAPEREASAWQGPNLNVAVDSDRRQITFKVSYNSAIITAFTLVVVVSLAYVVGRKMSHGPLTAVASETSEQLRAGSPHPDVMKVSANATRQPTAPPQPAPVDSDDGLSSRPKDDAGHPGGAAKAAPDPVPAAGRIIGLNYVVVQSYPEEASAVEARDALLKCGVGCSIEQKLRGLNSSWFIVVGTQGFEHPSGTEYQAYVKKIEEASYQFTRAKRGAKPFTPFGYKWDKPAREPLG